VEEYKVGIRMKRFTIDIDDELERKLAITAEGYKTCIENYIIQVLELDVKETEQYFREEGIEIF
jgi:hypothetical protein